MWFMFDKAEVGKTYAFKNLTVSSISDRLLGLASFGNDACFEVCLANSFYSNSRVLDFKNEWIMIKNDDRMGFNDSEFVRAPTLEWFLKYLYEVKKTVLDPSSVVKSMMSHSYTIKTNRSFVDASQFYLDNSKSLIWFKFDVPNCNLPIIAALEIIDDQNLICDFSKDFYDNQVLKIEKIIDWLRVAPNSEEYKGFLTYCFLPYEIISKKIKYQLLPMIGTEGFSLPPMSYVRPAMRVTKNSENQIYERSIRPIFNLLVNYSDGSTLSPIGIKDFFTQCVDVDDLREFIKSSAIFINKLSKKIYAKQLAEDEIDDPNLRLLNNIGSIECVLTNYYSYLNSSESSEMSPESFITDSGIAFGKCINSDGKLKFVSIAKSPVIFQLDSEGYCIIDSLLTYVFNSGSSYLKSGISSDLVQLMALTTYSRVIGLYAKMGTQNDPLSQYSFEGLQTGDLHYSIDFDGHVDVNGAGIQVTDRFSGRDYYSPLCETFNVDQLLESINFNLIDNFDNFARDIKRIRIVELTPAKGFESRFIFTYLSDIKKESIIDIAVFNSSDLYNAYSQLVHNEGELGKKFSKLCQIVGDTFEPYVSESEVNGKVKWSFSDLVPFLALMLRKGDVK